MCHVQHVLFRSKVGSELKAVMAARGRTDAVGCKPAKTPTTVGAECEDIEVDLEEEEEASQLY